MFFLLVPLVSEGELILQKNYLNGTIPASVGLMTSLTMLELNSNDLSGIIPSEIAYLPSLRVLNLEGNRLTGTIPREFHKLKALRSLRLDSNMLSGTIPTSIGLMTALRKYHCYLRTPVHYVLLHFICTFCCREIAPRQQHELNRPTSQRVRRTDQSQRVVPWQ